MTPEVTPALRLLQLLWFRGVEVATDTVTPAATDPAKPADDDDPDDPDCTPIVVNGE